MQLHTGRYSEDINTAADENREFENIIFIYNTNFNLKKNNNNNAMFIEFRKKTQNIGYTVHGKKCPVPYYIMVLGVIRLNL